MLLLPRGEKVRRTKGRNHRAHSLPNLWLRPNEPSAPWTEQPFACAGRKCVASQRCDLWIFHSKPMHTVNDQQHTIFFVAATIYFRQCLSNAGDGQSDAAAGVHVGDADRSRVWSEGFVTGTGD